MCSKIWKFKKSPRKKKKSRFWEKQKEKTMNIVLRMTCLRNKTWDLWDLFFYFVANAMHETTNKMNSVIKKTFMYILTCKSGTIDIQPFPCLVISGISCHCIWTNTDYYNNNKKVPPCLIEIFGNWPEKLINFFVLP